jgi:hypothetical protein
MSSHKSYFLGIVSIILLSNPSQAFAESNDDNMQVRTGKIEILLNSDGSTQIKTDRLVIKSELSKVPRGRKYRHRIRSNRVTSSSEQSTSEIDSSESYSHRQTKIYQPNRSSSSSNHQVIRVTGNNRTVIQSSTNNK